MRFQAERKRAEEKLHGHEMLLCTGCGGFINKGY